MESKLTSFKGKKALITGGLGFLGSHLAHRLVRLETKVTLLDNFLKVHGANRFNVEDIKKKVRIVKGDIRSFPLMKRLVRGQDFIFNIGAQTSHTDSMQNPWLDQDINTKGQISLLEAVKKTNPEARIVYCSTRAVYGGTDKRVIGEDTLPNPLDIYAAHKLAGEHYHRIYGKVFGLNTIILRVANGYGPRAQMKLPSFGILNWFIRLALDNQPIKIFGDGKQVRDYVYAGDIVEAFLAAAGYRDAYGEIFNVGSGLGVPLIEIVESVVRIAGKGAIVHVPWPETNKKIDVGDFIAEVSKIKTALGWRATTPLEEGLTETIRYYEKNKKHYWP